MAQIELEHNIDDRRKKFIFRSWHRGTREIDLILGRFADAHLPDFTEEQLNQYEELLKNSDPDIYNWVTQREPVPAEHDSEVVQILINSQAE